MSKNNMPAFPPAQQMEIIASFLDFMAAKYGYDYNAIWADDLMQFINSQPTPTT